MRVHIDMDEGLIRRIDEIAGRGGRSRFVREAVVAAIEHRDRAELIMSARGGISSGDHEWDADPAAWVRGQRRGDAARVG